MDCIQRGSADILDMYSSDPIFLKTKVKWRSPMEVTQWRFNLLLRKQFLALFFVVIKQRQLMFNMAKYANMV